MVARGSIPVRAVALAACLVLGVGGCDDNPPPRPERKLPIPKGESTLDTLIRKAQDKPRPPPAPGHLTASTGAIAFPPLAAGDQAVRQIDLANTGELPVTLGTIHVAGQASAYRVGGSCGKGVEVAPGASCQVEVTFRPARQGIADGEVVVDQVGGGGSLFVSLSGEAGPSQADRFGPSPSAPVANAEASLLFARSRQDAGLVVEDYEALPPLGADDPNYTEAGLPGIVSSLPVDRSRVITADRYIPAVLENTINSQLPGRAIAVVERPVYGSDGRLVLIPAGSRVIGRTQSLAKVGQARLDISWWRIIRPDGVNINIDSPGADVMGRTGLPGDLDSRFFEKYGSSLLTSVIAAGGEWVLDGSSAAVVSPLGGTTQSLSGKAQAANRLGNDLDALGQRMVQENVDIRPVLTVAQGTRLNIIPAEDIWLRDPNHLRAVTPPKGSGGLGLASPANLAQLLPALIQLVAQNPQMQKLVPQTAQQLLQSDLLQQLRDANPTAGAAGGPPAGRSGTGERP